MAEAETGWPDGVLFWPPRQIPYQTDYITRMYLMRQALLAADLGTGKTVMSLGVAGLAMEDGDIDLVLVVCERNKLSEWKADFGTFTRIPAEVYHGPRRRRLLEGPLPAAVITTYETCRDDVAVFPPRKSRARTLSPGPLMDALRGRRVLVIYDEVTKLGNRSSNLYKGHFWMLGQLRKEDPGLRVIGMSATPMDTGFENIFNEMRVIAPQAMPKVTEFSRRCIRSRHPKYGTPSYSDEGVAWFRSLAEPWILRKRKSDPDVREFFPPLTERFIRLDMGPRQLDAYRALEDLSWDEEGNFRDVPGLATALRQLAGDPWAILEGARTGSSPLTKMVAEQDVMGAELERCSSAKADELARLCDLVMSSGGKLLVFTFFGQSVLPALARRLGDRPVWTYHGGQSTREQDRSRLAFRGHHGGGILLASDAGARGINLPEASYVVNYDVPRTHALAQQRAGRGHRLGKEDPLTVITFILEHTLETRSSIPTLLRRNRQQDYILGDEGAEGHVSAADRALMFAQSRPRRPLA